MNATSPFVSSLDFLFVLFIRGSKNAIATITQITVKMNVNKQAIEPCKICHPDQHLTAVK